MSTGLTQYEELGLKIIVLIREKLLDGFECASCTSELQESRNCVGKEDHETPVYYHPEVGEFYACPLTFISPVISDFVDRYDYYEKYPSAVLSYEDVNPRFWEAVKFYESFKYKIEQSKDKVADSNKSEDNLSKMRSLFKDKKVT